MSDCVRHHPNGAVLLVRVLPGASSSQLVGFRDDELKVRVCSPPVDGRANKEVVRVVAAALGVRNREVELIAGHAGRSKQLLVALAATEVRRRLDLLVHPPAIGTQPAGER